MKDKCIRYLKKPLICSFVLNLAIALLLFLIYDFHWETNDDVYMSSIAYGTYGQYDEHLMFINIIIGRLLKGLLTLCPWIPWYGVLQTAIVFVSFVIIGYRIYDIRLDFEMLIISTVIIWIMGLQFYVQMQFTKTAGIASIAGILLILRFCAQRKGKNWVAFAIGLVMCSVGIMYRVSPFYPSFAILFVLGVYELVYYNNRDLVKRLLRYGGCALLLLVIIKGLVVCNNIEYNKNAEYKSYAQFNSERVKLTDFYWPNYYDNIVGYEKLGISKLDIDFYASWNLADKAVINTQNLKIINSFKDDKSIQNGLGENKKSVQNFLVQFYNVFMNYSFIIALVFITLIEIKSERSVRIFFCVSSVVFIALEFYLYNRGRVFIQRVDAVFMMAFIVAQLVRYAYEKKEEKKWMIRITIIMLPLILLNLTVQGTTDGISKISEKEQQEWIDYLQNNKDTLFMMESWTNVYLLDSIYSIWDVPAMGLSENVYLLGGWLYQSPYTNGILDEYGIDNPMEDMVGNDKVCFVVNGSTDAFEQYIERHYYENVKFEFVNKIGDSCIYRVAEDS